MRYRYTEYSAQNKRQYFIAVGLAELKILQGLAAKALIHFPHVQSDPYMLAQERHLGNISRGLAQAMKEAERLVDSGERRGLVPNKWQDKEKK